MAFKRRTFLQAALAGATGIGAGASLPSPQVRRSAQGLLATRLRVGFERITVPGLGPITVRCYDGGVPGPTLRVRPGDVLRLTQTNDLTPDAAHHGDHNVPHDFNTFNLHTHGLHVAPDGIADNVFRRFEPGGQYVSEIEIPEHHEGGTFWYHPHHHGSSAVQLSSGMAGALVVEGAVDEVPEIAAAEDVVVCVSELKLADGVVPDLDHEDVLRDIQSTFLVNGELNPVVRLRPGEVQRWRLIAAGAFTVLDVQLEGHELHQIAMDGLTFAKTVARQHVQLAMGNRADVLVKAGEPGSYRLTSGQTTLMTVIVEGAPHDMALPVELPGTSTLPFIAPQDLTPTGPHGNGRRTVVFHTDEHVFTGGFTSAFRILGDGATPPAGTGREQEDPQYGRFRPDFVNQRLEIGAVEEWTLRNTTPHSHANHPFHLHTNPFLVVAVNGAELATPVWQDTVGVPQGGEVVIRVRFENHRGLAVLHCHHLQHEDEGMMQIIEYV